MWLVSICQFHLSSIYFEHFWFLCQSSLCMLAVISEIIKELLSQLVFWIEAIKHINESELLHLFLVWFLRLFWLWLWFLRILNLWLCRDVTVTFNHCSWRSCYCLILHSSCSWRYSSLSFVSLAIGSIAYLLFMVIYHTLKKLNKWNGRTRRFSNFFCQLLEEGLFLFHRPFFNHLTEFWDACLKKFVVETIRFTDYTPKEVTQTILKLLICTVFTNFTQKVKVGHVKVFDRCLGNFSKHVLNLRLLEPNRCVSDNFVNGFLVFACLRQSPKHIQMFIL